MNPGIHENIPFAEYQSWNAASNSRLTDLNRSAAHMLENILNPKEQTEALIMGKAAHHCILQPDEFANLYVIADQCAATTKEKKRCSKNGKHVINGEWFCGQHVQRGVIYDPRTALTLDEYKACQGMKDSAWNHPSARAILLHFSQIEVSVLGIDVDSGVMCKQRPDLTCEFSSTILDLKTCEDASDDAFMHAIFKRGYFRQAAFYLDGLAKFDKVFEHFCFLAIEKKPPYACQLFRLKDDSIQYGREQYKRLLYKYADCRRDDRYPGYSDEVKEIGLKDWAKRQLEFETAAA